MSEEQVLHEMSSLGGDKWLHHDQKNLQMDQRLRQVAAQVVEQLLSHQMPDTEIILEALVEGLSAAGFTQCDEGDTMDDIASFMQTKGPPKYFYLMARDPLQVFFRAQYKDMAEGKKEVFFASSAADDDQQLSSPTAPPDSSPGDSIPFDHQQDPRSQFLDNVTLQQTIFPHQHHPDVPTTKELELGELEEPATEPGEEPPPQRTEQQPEDYEDLRARFQGLMDQSQGTVEKLEQLYASMDGLAQKHEALADRAEEVALRADKLEGLYTDMDSLVQKHEKLASRAEQLAQRAELLDQYLNKQKEMEAGLASQARAIDILQHLDYLEPLTSFLAEESRASQKRLRDGRATQLLPLRDALVHLDRKGHLGQAKDRLFGRLEALEQQDVPQEVDGVEAGERPDLLSLLMGTLDLRQRLQAQEQGLRPREVEGLALKACEAVFQCRGCMDEDATPHLEVLCKSSGVKWIAPAPGAKFDSRRHEVVGTEKSSQPSKTVARVESVGLISDDRLIEKAKVVLSS